MMWQLSLLIVVGPNGDSAQRKRMSETGLMCVMNSGTDWLELCSPKFYHYLYEQVHDSVVQSATFSVCSSERRELCVDLIYEPNGSPEDVDNNHLVIPEGGTQFSWYLTEGNYHRLNGAGTNVVRLQPKFTTVPNNELLEAYEVISHLKEMAHHC
ncbi:unnamed protein product [Fasciola hepatica]|uniref:Uncharacterized protein n=1 Tax=Fasciola hepatica TaxID=6192 RepID=A0ABC9HJ66_FASHE